MATKKQNTAEPKLNTFATGPDERGFFGLFGGRFVAETLMPLILDLERAYEDGQGRSRLPRRDRPVSTPITPAGRARSISPSG